MKFQRVDADIADQVVDTETGGEIVDKDNKTESDKISEFFQSAIGREGLELKVQSLKSADVPALIILPEHMRRMTEMNMGMAGAAQEMKTFLKNHTLVVNASSQLVKNAYKISQGVNQDKGKKMAQHIYDLALLSSKVMEEGEMGAFIKRANGLLEELSS